MTLGGFPGRLCIGRGQRKAVPRVALTCRLGPRLKEGQNRAQLEEPVWMMYQKGLHILRKGGSETQRPQRLHSTKVL